MENRMHLELAKQPRSPVGGTKAEQIPICGVTVGCLTLQTQVTLLLCAIARGLLGRHMPCLACRRTCAYRYPVGALMSDNVVTSYLPCLASENVASVSAYTVELC